MLNTNFIITLLTVLATLFCLFQNEIKEGFINEPHGKKCTYDFHTPNVIGHEPDDGTMKDGKFALWQGNVGSFQPVLLTPTVDPRNNKPIAPYHTKIGYDTHKLYDAQPVTKPRERRENYTTFERNSGDVMVEAPRNMQNQGPPPRFMVAGPKYNLSSPIHQAKYAVDTKNTMPNYWTDVVHEANYDSTGTLIKGACKTSNIRESYEDKPLPRDMTNSSNIGMGDMVQPIITPRVMWSNVKSRLQSGGVDRIRGDVPIVANKYKSDPEYRKWFEPSVHMNIDLAKGYISDHNASGKENDFAVAALGLKCGMLNSPEGCASDRMGSFGSGQADKQGAYPRPIKISLGSDVEVETRGVN